MAPKYDCSKCDMFCDNETLLEAMVRIKKPKKIWIATRRKIVIALILSRFLPKPIMRPLINVPQIDARKPKVEAYIPPQTTTEIVANKQLDHRIASPGPRRAHNK